MLYAVVIRNARNILLNKFMVKGYSGKVVYMESQCNVTVMDSEFTENVGDSVHIHSTNAVISDSNFHSNIGRVLAIDSVYIFVTKCNITNNANPHGLYFLSLHTVHSPLLLTQEIKVVTSPVNSKIYLLLRALSLTILVKVEEEQFTYNLAVQEMCSLAFALLLTILAHREEQYTYTLTLWDPLLIVKMYTLVLVILLTIQARTMEEQLAYTLTVT